MQYYLWATRTSADVSVPRLAGFSLLKRFRLSVPLMRDLLAVRRVSRPREQEDSQPRSAFRCPILLRTMREVCATTTA